VSQSERKVQLPSRGLEAPANSPEDSTNPAAGGARSGALAPEKPALDPALSALIDAWPTLPEPLLIQAYEGLSELEATLGPLPSNWRLAEAIERIVWFYEATQQPDKARLWRGKLARLIVPSGSPVSQSR